MGVFGLQKTFHLYPQQCQFATVSVVTSEEKWIRSVVQTPNSVSFTTCSHVFSLQCSILFNQPILICPVTAFVQPRNTTSHSEATYNNGRQINALHEMCL
uniref:Uncharacterized protein n=1 Tax=Sphaerodactylus townsendi TaxID=933632 RepID=A0ACB8F5E2_9SAUR